MLRILCSLGYMPERQYIYDVLIRNFLGLDYYMENSDREDTRISLHGDPTDRVLTVSDVLFQTAREDWLTAASLPRQPLRWWDVSNIFGDDRSVAYRLPIIYGKETDNLSLYTTTNEGAELRLDVFGSAFFMLTWYEEIVNTDRDKHDRFPARASLAFQEGFLERPIINEYVEVLWIILQRLWPGLLRKSRTYRLVLSHDVDRPVCTAGRDWFHTLRSSVYDVVKRHDISLALSRLRFRCQGKRGFVDGDPCNTFDFIMELSETYGRRSAFYFIADHSAGRIDGTYNLEDSWIRSLMKRIDERGHEVGLHPSYNSYRDPAQIKREFEKLSRISVAEGLCQKVWGGRQHYLRWENPTTWQNWEDAGLRYDSTLSFADHVGFRCGVCWEYPTFNLRTRQCLKLRERPLVVMEGTLLEYMGLTWEASARKILNLSATCKKFKGDFTLLWHNSSLVSKREQYWYREICKNL